MNLLIDKYGIKFLNKIFFIDSLLVILFVLAVSFIKNIYSVKIVGVLAEILWLPVSLSLVASPFIGFYIWSKEKFKLNSLSFYALLIAIVSIIFIKLK